MRRNWGEMMDTNWKTLVGVALKKAGEDWSDIVANTMSDADMEKEFDDGFGGAEGCAFTIWTTKFVYFPCVYDGAEWVERVSRNHDGIPTEHIGGQ